jgi:hypothetical protein
MNSTTQLLHLLFIIFFVTLPLYPLRYMYLVRWVPLLLIINWFIFDGCPLTQIDINLDDKIFSQVLLEPAFKLKRSRAEILTYIILFMVFFFCNKKYYEQFL